MKKFIIKTLTIILLVSILFSNFCYATALTNETLKNSLKKIFGSNVKIETYVESESSNGSSTITYTAPAEVIIDDNQIILTETEEGESITFTIDYLLEDNQLEFIMDTNLTDLNISSETDEESLAISIFGLVMMQSQSMQLAFLATADALGLDLEMANSYYSQLLNETSETLEDETTGTQTTKYDNHLFTYTNTLNSSDTIEEISMNSSLIINLEEYANITESSLDGTTRSVITLSNTPTIDEDKQEEDLNQNVENNTIENTNTENNAIENESTNTENNVVNRNVIHLNTDNTVANTIIPATGTTNTSFIIVFIIALALFFYSRSKYYDDIV